MASYLPIEAPDHLDGLVRYTSSGEPNGEQRWFCGTCGCHVFRRRLNSLDGEQEEWEVATGTVEGEDALSVEGKDAVQFKQHVNVKDTLDGGLAVFMRDDMENDFTPGPSVISESSTGEEPTLPFACHCGLVRFAITRPDESSVIPTSGFADLLIPYHTQDPKIKNPDDEKWWLRPAAPSPFTTASEEKGTAASKRRFLAGTCTCRSCRLASGFEIQSWAFVPASNILFSLPSLSDPMPLDFPALASYGVLKSYASSPGVLREFCPGCGATVFWHDAFRPLLIDVSLGLLRPGPTPAGKAGFGVDVTPGSGEVSGVVKGGGPAVGSRAEAWLDWHRDRVSFSEEVGRGRDAAPQALGRAEMLIRSLERGLRESKSSG